MNTKDLKSGYSIYGNKGNVWSNTAHIYKSGTGNLCGTPALASNWAKIEGLEHIGCPNCLEKYQELEQWEPEFDSAGFSIADRYDDDEEQTHHCDDLDCNCSI